MISLERLLEGLEVAIEAFAVCSVRREWSLAFEPVDAATVHYVCAGSGMLELSDATTVPLTDQTFTILPPRCRARIVPAGGAQRAIAAHKRCAPLPGGWERVEAGTGGAGIVMVCGRIRVTYQFIGLFDRLPAPLVEDFRADDRMRRAFAALLDEVGAQRPGSRAMADTLLRECLILLLRRYWGRGRCELPWLAALADARLSRAITAMLDRPDHPFTLEGLAEVAGMSRSAFAARFAETFGQSPIEFLTVLRLNRAARLLRSTDLPVKTIAGRVGYSSRSYFSRAFKTLYGVRPAAVRTEGLLSDRPATENETPESRAPGGRRGSGASGRAGTSGGG